MAGEHVLVVDDDPGIRSVLRGYLENAGYQVAEASGGADALAAFEVDQSPPEVVLLDVGLPDIDGLEVLRRIRMQSEVFVLMVTARVEEVDRLVGLGMGADDYISKPFSPREVVARVGVVLRRAGDRSGAEPRVDPALKIDPASREILVDGRQVDASALEFDLLALLASRPGQVFTRRQILDQVWGDGWFGDERVVDVHVRSLRALLGDDATSPRFIATVRGVGYKTPKDDR